METIEFITKLKERVIENENKVYQNLLNTTTEARDPLWQGILPIYGNMTKDQQASFLKFLRMIQVNTLSHILGILDGSTYLNENNEDFILKTEQNEHIINGDLQDIFLAMEEDSNK
jgi:hypothetical protein